jgi:hypothetical protein
MSKQKKQIKISIIVIIAIAVALIAGFLVGHFTAKPASTECESQLVLSQDNSTRCYNGWYDYIDTCYYEKMDMIDTCYDEKMELINDCAYWK